MRRVVQRLWGFLKGQTSQKRLPLKRRDLLPAKLELLVLEDRVVPSATPLSSGLGTLSGSIGATFGSTPFAVSGIQVELTGSNGTQFATSDQGGAFAFRSLQPGTYSLTTLAGTDFLGGSTVSHVTVTAGKDSNAALGVGGLTAFGVSLRDVTNTASASDVPFQAAGPLSDADPSIAAEASLANMVLDSNNDTTTVDLAADFTDPNASSGSEVQFTILDGTTSRTMDIDLDDTQAPQTVANFLDYVEAGKYNNTIFHRLSSLTSSGGVFANTPENVLQGGGFDAGTFDSVSTSSDPEIANESTTTLSNTADTISMARESGDNTATSQFFLNITANTSLNPQSGNGTGYAVFGTIASDPTSQATFAALQGATPTNESTINGAFTNLPLVGFSGSGTPASSNYETISSATVIKNPDTLTYTATSSNTNLVNVQFEAGHPEYLQVLPVSGQSGTATITVTATDDVGKSVSDKFTVTVDPLSISSVSTNPQTTAGTITTTVSGVATAGATVSLTATDGTTTTTAATATAGSNGLWTINNVNVSSLSKSGTITYNASTTNGSGSSSTTITTSDTTPALAITQVPATINAAGVATGTLSGTAESGASVTITASEGSTTEASFTTTATGGTWSASFAQLGLTSLTNGQVTFTANATDTSGNTTTATGTATLDTSAPQVTINSVGTTITSPNVTVTGTATPGSTVAVTAADTGTGLVSAPAVTANASGLWTANLDVSTLATGTITFNATATNAAGNSANTDSNPATATNNVVTGSIDITSATNPILDASAATVTVSGTATAGDSISVVATDASPPNTSSPPATTTANSQGNWSVTFNASNLQDGSITYTASDTTDSTTTALTATKDSAAPTVAITTVANPINSTNVSSVTVSGTATANASVSVVASEGGTTITTPVTTTAATGGTWTVNVPVSSLPDGLVTFTATATDTPAGNSATTSATATKETVVPTATINSITSPVTTSNSTVTGTGIPGSTVTVTVTDSASTPNTATAPSVIVGENGTWSAVVNVSHLTNGTITYTASATDLAGNSVTATKTATLQLA